ncbi:MAG TPA: SpoIIE family protein phosphatase, partial [Bacillota bacterium]|nr:SpoIIE family protein phosphatase [Bacillota bacterium]
MTTGDLCADIGALSINLWGEQLCGDSVEVIQPEDDDSTVIVIADGLGSGVKANILSTLTSKIISTMLAAGMRLEDAVETIIATLPVCSVRGIAYSTFTIIRITGGRRAEIIIYDNPRIIMMRDGENYELLFTVQEIYGKRIMRAETDLCEGD